MRRISIALAVTLCAISPAAVGAQDKLEVIVFPGGSSWPLWAAQEKGFFAREGLEVRLTPKPSKASSTSA
jgi:ABC-type nitrate/sulfonate/bicarbonate transport system substrate-binding protein